MEEPYIDYYAQILLPSTEEPPHIQVLLPKKSPYAYNKHLDMLISYS